MIDDLKNKVMEELKDCNDMIILSSILSILEVTNGNLAKPYTIKEAANELNVTPQTVRVYIHQGKLKAKRMTNKKNSKFLIEKNDLIDFMDKYMCV